LHISTLNALYSTYTRDNLLYMHIPNYLLCILIPNYLLYIHIPNYLLCKHTHTHDCIRATHTHTRNTHTGGERGGGGHRNCGEL
jgi:23S rRNA A1618 N6-methylase RlmF